jgi:tetratricopeptide (TPR) repeat protein
MRHRLMLAWLAVVVGCTFNPGAAQQALIQADVQVLRKDYVAAIGLYDQVLAADPTLAVAHLHRGVAYRGHGNFERALADLDRALELGPQDSESPGARAWVARVLAERARTKLEFLAADAAGDKTKLAAAFAPGDPLGIAADLDKAVELDGMNQEAAALLLHGAMRLMQNRDADAQKDFERFVRRRPQAQADLDFAIGQWKKERPVLDLAPIDDLGRMRSQRG